MKKATRQPDYELIVINSLEEIPVFTNEDEEREFWATHEFSDELWESLPHDTTELDELLPVRQPRAEVSSWDEVPDFASEDEERTWWEARVPSEALLESLPERPIMPTRLETLRAFVALGRKNAKRKVS
jgi:hypothetical protein